MRCEPRCITARATLPALAAAVLAIGGALIGGCDEPAMRSTGEVVVADTQPATTAPALPSGEAQPAGATQPHAAADTQPANAFLTIEGRLTEFPAARLRLSKTDDGLTALLFSDDPKTATSAGYKGNSFYFDLPLKVTEPGEIVGATYGYRAEDSDPSDTPNGIFLSGTRYHLQPQDVAIRFNGEGKKVMAQISGRFLVVRTTGENVPGQLAAVQGTLYTTAEVED